jgi:hypothetical protein
VVQTAPPPLKNNTEHEPMKTPKIYYSVLAVFCLVVMSIGIANASAMTQQGSGNHFNDKGGQFVSDKLLSNLTAKGYDVSAIRAAVTSGDNATAMTLMKEFRTAHPEEFPIYTKGPGIDPINGPVHGQRMSQMLDNLTAQGYDVSAIREAGTSGNYETAHTLMREFRTAHPDALPTRGEGTGKGHRGWQRCGKESSVI